MGLAVIEVGVILVLSGKDNIKDYCSDIKYSYKTTLNIYTPDGYRVNPSGILELLGFTEGSTPYSSTMTTSDNNVWQELLDNKELLEKQYEVLAGSMPQNSNEVVVIVDKNNRISLVLGRMGKQ